MLHMGVGFCVSIKRRGSGRGNGSGKERGSGSGKESQKEEWEDKKKMKGERMMFVCMSALCAYKHVRLCE